MLRLTQQIKKYKIVVAALAVFVCVAIALVIHNKQPEDRLVPVTINAITTKNGWGYQIFVDGKTFIKQENVPAIPGYRSFATKEQALAVGNLAVKKIVQGQIPSITKAELKSLGVIE